MVALNEVVNLVRVSMKDCFIFKVDFENSYVLDSFSFMEYMLNKDLVLIASGESRLECVFSLEVCLLVNGCPS